jgi:hypothetical protein
MDAKPGGRDMRRALVGTVIVVGTAALVHSAEPGRSKTFESELRKVMSGVPPTTATLWPLVGRCVSELARPRANEHDWGMEGACGGVVERLAHEGDAAEGVRLWQLWDGLSGDSPLRSRFLDGILDARLEAAMARVPKRGTAPALPRDAAPLPKHLADAEPRLQAAWRSFHRVQSGYRSLLKSNTSDGGVSVQKNWPPFHADVAAFLRGKTTPEESIRRVGRYVWGDWCGTGMQGLTDPQAKAMLLALLKQQRYAPAAAAALQLQSGPMFSMLNGEIDRVVPLLEAAGLDWEPIVVGAVLDGLPVPDVLARRGSAGSAVLLLAALNLPQPYGSGRLGDRGDVLAALAVFVDSKAACEDEGHFSWPEVVRVPSRRVASDIQLRILQLLADRVQPTESQWDVEIAASLLLSRCRPESRDAFLAMTRSPFGKIRPKGVLGLRALGENPPALEEARPVAFRILVDGEPLAATSVGYEIQQGQDRRQSDKQMSDHDGVVHLDRDLFVDPKAPALALRLSPNPIDPALAPWFAGRLPVPSDLDAVTTLEIATQSLTISAPTADANISVMLQAQGALLSAEDFSLVGSTFLPLPPSRTLRFPRLQRGVYQVTLLGQKYDQRWSKDVTLGDEPVFLTAMP